MSDLQWLAAHGAEGILQHSEVKDMKKASARIFYLLADLQWHDAEAIRNVAGKNGILASEGLRRMCDLRKPLQQYNIKIKKARLYNSRNFYYRFELGE
jgi:hypothetical protein